MARYPVVLFDLDGTLIDTNHLIITSFQHTFKTQLNIDMEADVIRTWFGEPLPVTFRRHAKDEEQVEQLVAAYREFNLAQHDTLIRLIPGVQEAVQALHAAGIVMGIVTSKKESVARMGLAAAGLTPYFPVLVGLESTSIHKPKPEPALLALQMLKQAPSDAVLMVGDAGVDILCGKAAGVRTAAVGWTALDVAQLKAAQPDHWVGSPADLVKLILNKDS